MRAALTTGPGQMASYDLPAPEAGPGQVRVSVGVVGLCGGDIHIYRGQHPYATYPLVQGHEFCGTVLSVGARLHGRPASWRARRHRTFVALRHLFRLPAPSPELLFGAQGHGRAC